MIRVTADRDLCIGSENCARYAAATFRTDPDGKVEVLAASTDSDDAIRRAVDACPVAALSLAEGASGTDLPWGSRTATTARPSGERTPTTTEGNQKT